MEQGLVYIIIILAVLVLAIVGIFFWIRKIKLKRQFKVPNEVLQELMDIERRFKINGGQEPYRAIWEYAKDRPGNKPRTSQQTSSSGEYSGNQAMDVRTDRGQELQTRTDLGNGPTNSSNDSSSGQPRQDNNNAKPTSVNTSIFARFKRN